MIPILSNRMLRSLVLGLSTGIKRIQLCKTCVSCNVSIASTDFPFLIYFLAIQVVRAYSPIRAFA